MEFPRRHNCCVLSGCKCETVEPQSKGDADVMGFVFTGTTSVNLRKIINIMKKALMNM